MSDSRVAAPEAHFFYPARRCLHRHLIRTQPTNSKPAMAKGAGHPHDPPNSVA